MNKIKLFIFIVLLILTGSKISAQENIYFNFDYSIFKSDETNSVLEVYYSVNQKSLTYVKSGDNYEGFAKIHILLTNRTDNSIVIEKSFKSSSIVKDTSGNELSQNIIGQINFLIGDGYYKLKLTGSDFNNDKRLDVFEEDLSILNAAVTSVRMSSIELSTDIKKSANEKSIFYKNTLDVIPNPSNLFGMNLKELYYYFEIYGLNENNVSDEITIKYSVEDLNNKNILSFDKKIKRNSDSRVEYGKINIDSLQRGSYYFRIKILDPSKNLSLSGEKKFFVFNISNQVTSNSQQDDYLISEYPAKDEKDLDKEFAVAAYLMTEKEIDRYEDMKNLDLKRKFMYDFWKSRDSNPGTPQNEFKIGYLKRVNEANNNFKEAYKEGWKTDRGRVYLVYGKPDDIERFPFETTKKSYEIWKYDSVEGGGECVFIEKQSTTGVYWLVHSTFKSELKNYEWEKELAP
ncbi:MAG: hypothetical protein HGGPFJEG_02192 [Ignavibacteria bacterium]|nr:hypothetical protein [Ignavibacteria bacterium]